MRRVRYREVLAEALYSLDHQQSLGIPHDLWDRWTQVNEPFETKLLQFPQFVELHGNLSNQIVVEEQLLEIL